MRFSKTLVSALAVVSFSHLKPDLAFAGPKDSGGKKAVLLAQAVQDQDLIDGVKNYTGIADALASDNLEAAKLASIGTKEVFDKLSKQAPTARFSTVTKEAETLSKAVDLKAARENFKSLSKVIVELVSDNEKVRANFHIFRCPMVEGFGKWVQATDKVKNPFWGTKMLTCGSKSEWKL